MDRYGLLGKTLKYSFSKPIHEKIAHKKYELIELESIDSFMKDKSFKGINVTIPYKQAVIPYVDNLSDEVKAIGTVNTIVNEDGVLSAFNTDAFGFEYLLDYNSVSIKDLDVLILGNGSTSKTIEYVCNKLNAKNIYVSGRNPNKDQIHLSDIYELKNVDVIINTTPVGTYGNSYKSLNINLDAWPQINTVIDVVYNPLYTPLLLEAKRKNIKAVNGLLMLVAQATKSIEYFHKINVTHETIKDSYLEILKRNLNITLIGMPMSGKTLYGKKLSTKFRKAFKDSDKEIEAQSQMSIPNLFKVHGEDYFREIEAQIICELSQKNNQLISCGGGVPMFKENVDNLKQNGLIIFINTPLETLKNMNVGQRPLLKNNKSLELLFEARYNTYINVADVVFNKTSLDINKNVEALVVLINEYISSQWT